MADKKTVFNELPEKIKTFVDERIKALKSRGAVSFQMLNGRKENYQQSAEELPNFRVVYPALTELPVNDIILDPESNKSIRIGVISGYDTDGDPIYYTTGRHVLGEKNGIIRYDVSEPEGRAWVEFLLLCSYNAKSKYRRKSVEPLFEPIDVLQKAKDSNKAMDDELAARLMARDMSGEERITFAASMGWDETEDIEFIEEKVNLFAKNHPAEFLMQMTTDSNTMKVKAAMKKAFDAGVITYNIDNKSVHWAADGKQIATIRILEGKDHLDGFAEYLKTTNGGKKIYSAIVKAYDPNYVEDVPAAKPAEPAKPVKKEEVKK